VGLQLHIARPQLLVVELVQRRDGGHAAPCQPIGQGHEVGGARPKGTDVSQQVGRMVVQPRPRGFRALGGSDLNGARQRRLDITPDLKIPRIDLKKR
jgi:hypothetical protein